MTRGSTLHFRKCSDRLIGIKPISFLTLILITSVPVIAQDLIPTNYTMRHGLPSNKVYDVTEDRNGFLWVATDQGVSRFDGVSFTNFSTDNGLPDNDVIKVLEDSMGRIWFMNFSSEPGYFYKGKIYSAENDTFLALLKQSRSNTPTIYAIDLKTKQIYFRVPNGIQYSFINRDTKRVINTGIYTGTSGVSPIYMFESADKILFADATGIFYKYKDLTGDSSILKKYLPKHLNGYDPINMRIAFSEWENGKSGWINLRNGVVSYTFNPQARYIDYNPDNSTLFLLNNNILYIGHDSKITSNRLSFRPDRIKIGNNGRIWLTSTVSGLYLIRNNRSFKLDHGDNQCVLALYYFNNSLLMGTDGGGLQAKEGDSRIKKIINRLPFKSIVGITKFNDNVILATDGGLISYNHYSKNAIFSINNSIKDVETYNGNEILIASSVGVFSSASGNMGSWNEYMHGRSTSVCRVNTSTIWFSKLQGLYQCVTAKKPYVSTQIITHTPLDYSYINDIKKDLLGNIWIATNQNGLYLFNSYSGFIQVNKFLDPISQNVPSNICKRIFIDSSNTIWVANAGSLARIRYSFVNKLPRFEIYNYTTADGLPDKGVNDVLLLGSRIIIATSSGCYEFTPSSPIQFTARTQITNIQVNGLIYNNSISELEHYHNDIIFNFTASFIDAATGQYHFKYRIKGLSEVWVHIYSTQIPLFGLAPGKYNLQIAAVGYNDICGPITSYPFTIYPPWYMGFQFVSIVSISTAFLIVVILKRAKNRITTKRNLAQMELKVLRNQMNPHFIFNSLNSIQQNLLLSDFRVTNTYISKFANFLRNNLHYSAIESISLEEEIKFLVNYLELENYRFPGLFDFHIIKSEDLSEYTQLPAFLVQPLVENSIKHGFKYLKHDGQIIINFTTLNNNRLRIEVIDNGIGLPLDFKIGSSGHSHGSVGLSIISQRIVLLKKQSRKTGLSFTIENRVNHPGVIATLILPLTQLK